MKMNNKEEQMNKLKKQLASVQERIKVLEGKILKSTLKRKQMTEMYGLSESLKDDHGVSTINNNNKQNINGVK